jgi:hypothetical protein
MSYEFDDEWRQEIFKRYEEHSISGLWEEYEDWVNNPLRERQKEHLETLREVIAWRLEVLSFDQFTYFVDTLFDEVIGPLNKKIDALKKYDAHRHETYGAGYSGKPVY